MSSFIARKFKRLREIRGARGWRGVGAHLEFLTRKIQEKINYQKWIRQYDALSDKDRAEIRRRIEQFERKPLITVVLPVYNVEEKWLRLCLDSVTKQIYENWEFCIADDCSPSPHIRKVLEEYAAKDNRFKIVFRETNGHISAASNSALELATGEFVVLLDHDDELAEHALYFVAEELNRFPQTDMIYSDEDMIDERGRRYAPKFKPDWSQDFFYSLNLITHLSAYRTEILRKIGGFRIGAEGSQDYDLALRVTEIIPIEHIRHIPQILYHWRAIQGSVALSGEEKPYAHERAREAIRAHLKRREKKAEVMRTVYNLHRVRYELPEIQPKISVLTLNDEKKFLESITAKTDYQNLKFISSASGKESPAEKFNELAKTATDEILIFLDGEFEITSSEWIRELAAFTLQKEIGAVGVKILHCGELIRNGGIILGVNNLFGFAHKDFPKEDGGSFGRTQVVNNFSAVSGAFAVRRELFEEMRGFDAENFPNGLFDVDFCLRLGARGFRIVFTPYAELVQTADSTTEKILRQKDSMEVLNFKKKWSREMKADKFYNPNLSLKDAKFRLAFPPRVKKPWLDS